MNLTGKRIAVLWVATMFAVAPMGMASAQSVPGSATPGPVQERAPAAPPKPAAPTGSLARFANIAGPGGVTLNVASSTGAVAHVLPTRAGATARASALFGAVATPLVYHAGGTVMTPNVIIYNIFWRPPTLQNGAATAFSPNYMTILNNLGYYYQGHSLGNINTQYYQTIGGVTSYIQNLGGGGGWYLDTSPYPASGCTDTATPGNCLTNSQIIAEIQKVMTIKGWTGGTNKIFLLYTSKGEGSCFDSTNRSCAYTQYCAYHSYYTVGGVPVIYGNEPYGKLATCQTSGAPSPNSDAEADTAATAASHEISEAITDPLLDAWYDSAGNENGDKCAYQYGANTWNGGTANQMWNGAFFELQLEWNNHTSSCVAVGP